MKKGIPAMSPFMLGKELDIVSLSVYIKRVVLVWLAMFGFFFCLALFFLGMRGVMKLGGFVASGGPYSIAHPAPDWVWVIPAAILSSIVFIAFNQYNAGRIGGVNLLILLWPITFLSCSYNFLEFGLGFQIGDGRLIWSWLLIGILFFLMGGIPFYFLFVNFIRILTGKKDDVFEKKYDFHQYQHLKSRTNRIGNKLNLTVSVLTNISASALGIYLGIGYFNTLYLQN